MFIYACNVLSMGNHVFFTMLFYCSQWHPCWFVRYHAFTVCHYKLLYKGILLVLRLLFKGCVSFIQLGLKTSNFSWVSLCERGKTALHPAGLVFPFPREACEPASRDIFATAAFQTSDSSCTISACRMVWFFFCFFFITLTSKILYTYRSYLLEKKKIPKAKWRPIVKFCLLIACFENTLF